MHQVLIRRAVPADAPAVAVIYNRAIADRSSTFETEPRSMEDRRRVIESQGERHPVLVAEHSGEVVGWASISSYRPRRCYEGVGEFSIYIHPDRRGKGIGKQLLLALLDEAARLGYWKLLSRVFSFNQASRALCASCGFREVGIYEKHSQLDGRWIDCVIVERVIEENVR